MTQLDRQVRAAQHRLWLNRWLTHATWMIALAAGVFALVVAVCRLYDLAVPLFWVGAGLGVVGVIGSLVWTGVTREDASVAAARLDEAAGLRERISSGQFCQTSADPFAQAVVADAERVSSSISVRQHIRLTFPRPFAYATMTVLLAALAFLISPGLLVNQEVIEAKEQSIEAEKTRATVRRHMDEVRKIAEETPALQDLSDKLGDLDKAEPGQLRNPGDLRHEAIKEIDRLADAVKQKRKSAKYDAVNEMRKRLRRLDVPKSSDAPTQKLAKALNQGDFKSAKEEIQKLKEQLATLKTEQDKELVKKMAKQLDQLGRQLEKLSKDEKLAKKLQEAGIKKEDAERMLENLSKKDLDQLKKQMQQKGMSQQQIQQLAKQMQQQQQAGGRAKQMSKAMSQAAKAASAGQMGEAMSGLSAAADQLSELEQLEQQMNELDSAMAGLQNTQRDLQKPCPGG